MGKRVDLHMHTTHSDGTFTPSELMDYCHEKNLACVAVTDHDTMSSYPECARQAEQKGVELIPGIEISAEYHPGTLHILGYFLDPEQTDLKAQLEEIQKARRERNPKMIEKLNDLGMEITLDEVIQEALGDSKQSYDKQIGRPHFAKVLIKKKYVKTFEEAFDRFLGKGKAAYVDKKRLNSQAAIRLIRNAGGVAVAAHPKQIRLAPEPLEKFIGELKDQGLGGIEVYSSCQSPQENKIYLKIAQRLGLAVTGGSDFHGKNKPDSDLGFMGQGISLGYETVVNLKEKVCC